MHLEVMRLRIANFKTTDKMNLYIWAVDRSSQYDILDRHVARSLQSVSATYKGH